MRNVLSILLVIVVLAPSCKKRSCWECETDITTMVVSMRGDSVKTAGAKNDILCDRTEKEIRASEKENSLTQTSQDSLTLATTYRTLKMKCNKQQ